MTLDESIAHYKNLISEIENRVRFIKYKQWIDWETTLDHYNKQLEDCNQLVAWLEELEEYRSNTDHDCISREQAINALNLLREMSKLVDVDEKVQRCIDTMEGILTDLPPVSPKVTPGNCGSYMEGELNAISD